MDQYNYNSRRAREARFGKVANTKAFWALIILAIITLLGLGGALIYLRNSWAWFAISMAAPLIMLLVWMKHEVRHIPIGQTESVNDLLSRECMQKLPAKPTTKYSQRALFGGALRLVWKRARGDCVDARPGPGKGFC